MNATAVVPAEGVLLDRVLAATYPALNEGLSRDAFTTLDRAQRKTPWGLSHQRRVALVAGAEVLASAQRSDLAGTLDGQHVQIIGIGAVCAGSAHAGDHHERALVDRLIADAQRAGADIALLFITTGCTPYMPEGFDVIPTADVELTVIESPRYGAPMTLVRSGEDRDLAAIAAMGQARAGAFRFHLDRDADFVKHAVTRKRLLAGLGESGVRALRFVIAEEGITAAAYLVITVVDRLWTIEECGDRDPTGARVGAILQALIALEPAERRPVIRGWLPPGFVPPQITIVSAKPSTQVLLGRHLKGEGSPLRLSAGEFVYWRSDIF